MALGWKRGSCHLRTSRLLRPAAEPAQKTDRIDAKLSARHLAFRPDVRRVLPAQKRRRLRALSSKRSQLVEARKRLLAQIKARQKQGVDELFQDMDAARRLVFDTQVVELENQIECLITGDVARAETVQILGSVPGVGPVASTMLIAEISGLGQISTEQAAALTGLAPIARGTGHENCQ